MNQKPPNNYGTQIIVKIFAAVVITIIAASFALILWWWFTPPQGVVEADEGFKKAKATIDPEKLRAWALEEISKRQRTNTNPPDSEIPTYIRNLYADSPENIEVDTNTVTIYWGGGFFTWMIEVGDTNYTETTGIIENHFTTVEWVPGIYYTREAAKYPIK